LSAAFILRLILTRMSDSRKVKAAKEPTPSVLCEMPCCVTEFSVLCDRVQCYVRCNARRNRMLDFTPATGLED
jgi:hypothetical protein